MRSMLFSPGNKPAMMMKSLSTEADAVILDLEDSVPADQKETARDELVKLLPSEPSKPIYVRVNAIDTPWILQDLLTLSRYPLNGVVVPKISHPGDVEKVVWLIERCSDASASNLTVIPIVETAQGVSNVREIAASSSRIEGIMFGALDYVLDVQGNTEDELSLVTPKALIAVACRANGIEPIDSVYPNFKDVDGLERECRRAKSLGFAGKACIHPAQAAVINKAFSAGAAEIAWAGRVVESYEKALAEGKGATSMDGSMVDLPVYEKAKKILSHK